MRIHRVQADHATRGYLFLKTAFFDRSKAMRLAASDFKRHIDYLVWLILLAVGCGIIYSVGKLIFSLWS